MAQKRVFLISVFFLVLIASAFSVNGYAEGASGGSERDALWPGPEKGDSSGPAASVETVDDSIVREKTDEEMDVFDSDGNMDYMARMKHVIAEMEGFSTPAIE